MFDLERAKKEGCLFGPDRKKARIICADRKNGHGRSVVVLVTMANGTESIYEALNDGSGGNCKQALFNLPVTLDCWTFWHVTHPSDRNIFSAPYLQFRGATIDIDEMNAHRRACPNDIIFHNKHEG